MGETHEVCRDRAAFEQSALPQAHIGVDGRVVAANRALADLLGTTPEALVGTAALTHFELLEDVGESLLAGLLSGEVPPHRDVDLAFRDADGRQQVLLTRTTVLRDEEGCVLGVHAVGRDAREVRHRLRGADAERALFGGTHPRAWDGVVIIDSDAVIGYVSPSILQTFGYRSDQLAGRSAFDFIHLDDEPRSQWALESALADTEAVVHATARVRTAGGDWRWCEVTLTNALQDKDVQGLIAMVRDMTDHVRSRHELRRQALHDALTGLPNRLLLDDRLRMAAARRQRDPQHGVALLFVDVNGLKQVNDRLGHAAGDALLVELAARLTTVVRETDTTARLGGDEFAVVCEAADTETARVVAARIHETLAAPLDLDGALVTASVSIGIATSPPHPVDELLERSDLAMYSAKGSRRGVVVHDEQLAHDAARRHDLRASIGPALRTDDLEIRYDRVLDVEDGSVVTLDAWPWWQHPRHGPVRPEEVQHAAREAGVQALLDQRQLETVCTDLRGFLDAGALGPRARVSLALSPGGLLAEGPAAALEAATARHRLPLDALCLRVSETVLGADVLARLADVVAAGVGLHLDGVGLQPSSLWRLHAVPLAAIRVDGAVLSMAHDRKAALLRTLVAVATSLGAPVVATGVTEPEHLDLLRDCGIRLAQGPLHGTALPGPALLGP